MPSVYLDNELNSTMFTTCCRVAITDRESNCPVCREEISEQTSRARWSAAYGPIRSGKRGYGHPTIARRT